MSVVEAPAIVIGAGPAGLACAASLKKAGTSPIVLEMADAVGASWRRHYDRLHLHTNRGRSGLPDRPMPKHYPRYPSRQQVVDYLEDYARHFGLTPVFNTVVRRVVPDGDAWAVETDRDRYRSAAVVVATGYTREPSWPDWPGLDGFAGTVLHSSEYRNPAPFAGKRVLVVGFGNSGGEIALDLAEAGVEVAMAIRGPVRVVPRDLLGLPILALAMVLAPLPPKVADLLSAPLIAVAVGRLRPLGLEPARHGPFTMIRNRHRIPLLDIGTLAQIRAGRIAVRPGVETVEPEGVVFADGTRAPFDAIVLATGYQPGLRAILPETPDVLDAEGAPWVSGGPTPRRGLYFCGFHISPTGMLPEAGREARRIARCIAEGR